MSTPAEIDAYIAATRATWLDCATCGKRGYVMIWERGEMVGCGPCPNGCWAITSNGVAVPNPLGRAS